MFRFVFVMKMYPLNLMLVPNSSCLRAGQSVLPLSPPRLNIDRTFSSVTGTSSQSPPTTPRPTSPLTE